MIITIFLIALGFVGISSFISTLGTIVFKEGVNQLLG